MRKRLWAACLAASLAFAACGQSSSSSYSPKTDFESPADGELMAYGAGFEIVLHNANTEKAPGTYSIYIYSDAQMTSIVEQTLDVSEDENGYVRWRPGTLLSQNRPYWWRWAVSFTVDGEEQTRESSLRRFMVSKKNGMSALSPRDGGYLDMNRADAPALAVLNMYTYGDAEITYDFKLYSEPDMSAEVDSVTGVAQQDGEIFTSWGMDFTVDAAAASSASTLGLIKDRTYYWRARAVVDGNAQDWTELYSFTVKNFCEIEGTGYAEYVTEWTTARECGELLRTDASAALGPPDAHGYTSQTEPGYGYVSIDIGGILGVEMGRAVLDGPGPDVRIYEYVSTEPIELFAAESEMGPWKSLGMEWCGEYCEYDLGRAGMRYARFFRMRDMWPPSASCYETAGADIDAVEALHLVYDTSQCVK